MIPEQFGVAHVTLQDIDRPMSGLVSHTENRRTCCRSRRQKSTAQRMPGELRRIEASAGSAGLDDGGDAAVGQSRTPDTSTFGNWPKHRTGADAGGREPSRDGCHWAGRSPVWNCNDSALGLLIGLAAADPDPKSFGHGHYIFAIQGHQLGSAQCAGEAQQKQRPIAHMSECTVRKRDHGLNLLCGGGRRSGRRDGTGATDAAQGRPYTLIIGRMRLACQLVRVTDRGNTSGNGGGSATTVGFVREEGSHSGRKGGQGAGAARRAPGAEDLKIHPVGAPRGGCLFRSGVIGGCLYIVCQLVRWARRGDDDGGPVHRRRRPFFRFGADMRGVHGKPILVPIIGIIGSHRVDFRSGPCQAATLRQNYQKLERTGARLSKRNRKSQSQPESRRERTPLEERSSLEQWPSLLLSPSSPAFVDVPHADAARSKTRRSRRALICKENARYLINVSAPYRAQSGGAIQRSVNLCPLITGQVPFAATGIKLAPCVQQSIPPVHRS